MSFHYNLQSLREHPETSRVGKKWTDEENTRLMEEATNGIALEEIAMSHQRTKGGVKQRIMTNALRQMDEESISYETISNRFHISVQDLKDYKERKDKKAAMKETSEKTSKISDNKHNDKKWTDEENTLLIKRVNDGMRLDVIATVHQRTIEQIKHRIVKNGLTLPDESPTINHPIKQEPSDIVIELLIDIRRLLKKLVNKNINE